MLRPDVKPSLMSAIELEFEHNPHAVPPPPPSRTSRVAEGPKKAGGTGKVAAAGKGARREGDRGIAGQRF